MSLKKPAIFGLLAVTIYFFVQRFWIEPVKDLALTPSSPTTENSDKQVQKLAEHLEKNPRLLAQLQIHPSPVYEEAPPFRDESLNSIRSQGIKQKLHDLDEKKAGDLLPDLDAIIENPDFSDLDEKFRLLGVRFYIDKRFALNSSQDVYIHQAEQNIFSDTPQNAAYGKQVLSYYLDLQPSDSRESKRVDFYTSRNVTPPPAQ